MSEEPLEPSQQETVDTIHSLRDIIHDIPENGTSFETLISALGHRSFGVAILFFSVPMVLPMPPGIPLSAGFVISILGVQILIGRPYLKLPTWLNQKKIDRKYLVSAYHFTEKYGGWIFRLAKYRLPHLTGPTAQRVSGGLFAFLGGLMILPIPFIGNILPALTCSIIALGLTDRDGVIFLIGIVVMIITLIAMFLMGVGTLDILDRLFS